jgi:hypothetical protein
MHSSDVGIFLKDLRRILKVNTRALVAIMRGCSLFNNVDKSTKSACMQIVSVQTLITELPNKAVH